jgi:nucleoside-diphosphate-sugar epimerase
MYAVLYLQPEGTMTGSYTRVLVLGATGHIGQAVMRHALERGRAVTAVTRHSNPESLRGLDVRTARIDSEMQTLDDVAVGHDVIIDAAAPYVHDIGIPGSAQWRNQVDGAVRRTESVIDAARRNHAQLVYVSSYATLPRPSEPGPAADAALWRRSISPYYETKIAMEEAVLAAAHQGLEAVIVNPVAFIGPWEFRDSSWSFIPLVLRGQSAMVNEGPMCVMDVRDIAEAIELALSQRMFGRRIPLAGHNTRPAELVARVAQLAGLPPVPPIGIPGFWVSFGAYWAHMACAATGMAPPVFLGLVAISPEIMPAYPSIEQTALGVKLRPLEESLRDAVSFHLAR